MKRIFILVSILVAFSILLLLYLWIGGQDTLPKSYPDLLILREEVPPEENLYPLILQAIELSTINESGTLIQDYRKDPQYSEAFATLMTTNREVYSILRKAQHRTGFQSKPLERLSDFDTPFSQIIGIAGFMQMSSYWHRERGETVEATGITEVILRTGSVVQSKPESLINYLIGCGILRLGLHEVHALARDPNTSEEEIRRLLTALDSLVPQALGLQRALKQEFKFAAAEIDKLAAGALTMGDVGAMLGADGKVPLKKRQVPGYLFQPNRSKEILAVLFRAGIREAPKNYIDVDLDVPVLKGYSMNLGSEIIRRLLRPNAIGRLLLSIFQPSSRMLIEQKCRVETHISVSRVLLAVRLFEIQKGRLPDTLSELIPEFLETTPEDPFDGKPLRYDSAKRILYSIGPNLVDDGGSRIPLETENIESEERKRWKAADAVFELDQREASLAQ